MRMTSLSSVSYILSANVHRRHISKIETIRAVVEASVIREFGIDSEQVAFVMRGVGLNLPAELECGGSITTTYRDTVE